MHPAPKPRHGFIIAAPHSGSGKTTITLGLLEYLFRIKENYHPAKAGPDFIDPQFHTFAARLNCFNLDPWAMRRGTLKGMAWSQLHAGRLVIEAMMGLFDGAADGTGSAADLAEMLGLPIVLVVDCAKQSHSIAALVSGFSKFRKKITIAGVILNRVGSPRHEAMLREALAGIEMPVFGAVYRDPKLELPSRHLGLVQPGEIEGFVPFLEHAADVMEKSLDWEGLSKLKSRLSGPSRVGINSIPPMGKRMAVAHDQAFSFIYSHFPLQWMERCDDFTTFSPLLNEAPPEDCDAVYLPGGYPELHAAKLAGNSNFLNGLRAAAERGAFIYGECGGYMVLGKTLIDAQGVRHKMANLLPLETSFENRKLHLGYRVATPRSRLPFLPKNMSMSAHEFHYSTVIREDTDAPDVEPLFDIVDARGDNLGSCGLRKGNVAGSYMHMIDLR